MSRTGQAISRAVKKNAIQQEHDAEISKLVAALRRLARRHRYQPGMGECVCEEHREADKLAPRLVGTRRPQ